MNRRHFLASAGAALGASAFPAELAVQRSGVSLEQEPLAYGFGELEPHMDRETVRLHYQIHHAAEVENLHKALDSVHLAAASVTSLIRTVDYLTPRGEPTMLRLGQAIDALPDHVRLAIRNFGGGHMNHTLFWRYMTPPGSAATNPQGELAAALQVAFGGFEPFKKAFTAAAMKHFGSGWAWLAYRPNGGLFISTTANHDNPLMKGMVPDAEYGRPILCLDLWEHAYYMKYQNRRADYIAAWWNLVNWPRVEQSYRIVTSTTS